MIAEEAESGAAVGRLLTERPPRYDPRQGHLLRRARALVQLAGPAGDFPEESGAWPRKGLLPKPALTCGLGAASSSEFLPSFRMAELKHVCHLQDVVGEPKTKMVGRA